MKTSSRVDYKIPVLETERLILREFRLADFDAYAQMMADKDYRRYLGTGEPLNRELAWRAYTAMIGHWVLRDFGFWALEVKETGEYIGQVGIHYPEDWPDIELGWGIKPGAQGKGYALEAAKAAAKFGFEELGLNKLISLIVAGNEPSANLASKLGEQHYKTIEMMGLEVHLYQILKEEWRVQQS